VARHDVYLTTGETVGTPAARFPDCGLPWLHIRPPVCLELWPYTYDPGCQVFTTVSNWWGHDDWIIDGEGVNYENNKRVTFLAFAELPRRTSQPLELALYLSDREYDVRDRQVMEGHGWRIRHSLEVARTPEMYQAYVRQSRGEFSCVKPSCLHFQNAWVSDRSLCYLASGKPVVVQNTGPSSFLPNGEGFFRFTTVQEAADALAAINADYERHCRTAREIAEAYFDSRRVVERVLSLALG
jgi:glycosyltransferase involved in cell wall biosynthesis